MAKAKVKTYKDVAGAIFRMATISLDGRYRYDLFRSWDRKRPCCVWVMLNPSTADDVQDDPTIRRCIDFAARWGCGSISVRNLFAWRATDPAELQTVPNPVGHDNPHWLGLSRTDAEGGPIVAAWGAHPLAASQVSAALAALGPGVKCLGKTQQGHPKHPLYVPAETQLIPFAG